MRRDVCLWWNFKEKTSGNIVSPEGPGTPWWGYHSFCWGTYLITQSVGPWLSLVLHLRCQFLVKIAMDFSYDIRLNNSNDSPYVYTSTRKDPCKAYIITMVRFQHLESWDTNWSFYQEWVSFRCPLCFTFSSPPWNCPWKLYNML